MKIRLDDLKGAEIAQFIEEHLQEMRAISPPESKHALDLDELRKDDIRFWTVWGRAELMACGALKHHNSEYAEIKSMRTSPRYQRQGIASHLLRFIIEVALHDGYRYLYIETGSMPYFEAARQLYSKAGFEYCEPFAGYQYDPNSMFMKKTLY